MRRLGDESGQTLVMVALSMAVLLGFAAFATDIGVMLHEKRKMQTAADSAAVASAYAISEKTDAVAAGTAAATANGYTSGTDANGYVTTVDIEPTPIDGKFAGQSGYTEAIITQQVPTFFMHLFGRDSATVSVKAVATDKGVGDNCGTVSLPTGQTTKFQGSFNANAPGCTIQINSSDPDALHFTGKAGSLQTAGIFVVGGDGGQTTDASPVATTGAAYSPDPLAAQLTPPAYNSTNVPCTTTAPPAGTSSTPAIIDPAAINPGSIDANGLGTVCYSNPTGNINLTNVTLSAGTYIFNNPMGTLVLSGNITGNGVTLYLLGGMNETAGTVLNLTAPLNTDSNTYAYSDILIYAATTDINTSGTICPQGSGNAGPGIIQLNLGNSSGNFTGMIYAPNTALVFQDSGSDSDGPDLITNFDVGTLCDETADLNITSYSKTINGGRFPRITLVE